MKRKKRGIFIFDKYRNFGEGFRDIVHFYLGEKVELLDSLSKDDIHVPKMIILEPDRCDLKEYLINMKKRGTKIVIFMLEPKITSFTLYNSKIIDGILLKNMDTESIIKVLEGILYYDEVYIHPYIGYQFYHLKF